MGTWGYSLSGMFNTVNGLWCYVERGKVLCFMEFERDMDLTGIILLMCLLYGGRAQGRSLLHLPQGAKNKGQGNVTTM